MLPSPRPAFIFCFLCKSLTTLSTYSSCSADAFMPPATLLSSRSGGLAYGLHSQDSKLPIMALLGNENEEDEEFYRDLQSAKKDKLGAEIPPEQLKESAKNAEEEFLQAMSKSREEFRSAKNELGSSGAIDMFLEKIREEDERREVERNQVQDDHEDEEDDESFQ